MQGVGFKIVVVTNQAGIGLGYFTKEDFFKVNKKMLQGFYENGIKISKIYFCPHSIDDKCNCRKPKMALFELAKKDLNIDFKKSFIIGDTDSDIKVGRKVGIKTILVTTGHGGRNKNYRIKPDYIVDDLIEASKIMKSKS